MARAIADILVAIDAFPVPADPIGGWQPFANLVAELEEAGGLPTAVPQLLSYFERHPTARLCGSLWQVAHTLEHRHQGQFEVAVLEAVLRRPSDFTVRLASRVACHGRPEVDGMRVVDVLESALGRDDNPPSLVPVIRMALAYAKG
jgi:hypothetical protein